MNCDERLDYYLDVLKEQGPNATAAFMVITENFYLLGKDTTYVELEEAMNLKTRSVKYAVRELLNNDLVMRFDAGGGRSNEAAFAPSKTVQQTMQSKLETMQPTPVNHATETGNHARNHATDDETMQPKPLNHATEPPKTMHETVQRPPHTPPIYNYSKVTKEKEKDKGEGVRGGDKHRKPLPEHGPAQQIVKAYCDAAGIEQPANYRQAVGQAQNLFNAGITPEDIPSLFAVTKEWLTEPTLGALFSQIDKWRQRRNKPKTIDPYSHLRGIDPHSLPPGDSLRAEILALRGAGRI